MARKRTAPKPSDGVYKFTGPADCKGCGAPLLWFKTPTGKNICINDGAPTLPVMELGWSCTRLEGRTLLLPFNHWPTCPDEAKFRGRAAGGPGAAPAKKEPQND